jgi:hypothetical protein
MSDESRLRPGRTKLYDGPPVSVRLTRTMHDTLAVEAIRRRVELSHVIRERLSISPVSQKTQK